jgi:hypothetical protein
MSDELGAPKVVDRSTFQAEMDALRTREKAHTREGDAIATARRRLPMVDGATPLIGERGAVTLLDVFEGCRLLIAYYFMWHAGQPAAEQCEGCTFYTSQVRELSFIHSRDVHLDHNLPRPLRRGHPVPQLHELGDTLVFDPAGLTRNSLGRTPGGNDAHCLLPATRIQFLRDLLDDTAWHRSDG